jgi:competence protein ComEC
MSPSRLPRRRPVTLALPAGQESVWQKSRSSAPVQSFGGRIRLWLEEELEQRSLFHALPVLFGIGIVLFFAADGPPLPLPAAIAASVFALSAFAGRYHFGPRIVLTGLCFLFLGFLAAALRVQSVSAPVLERIKIAPVSGFVETLEERDSSGRRIVLRVTQVEGLHPSQTPLKVRLGIRADQALKPGDFVRAQARLLPLPEAARPGGYDFARDAYFRGLGAVGSILGKVSVVEPPAPPDSDLRFAAWLDRARNILTDRIATTIGGQTGAVTAALVTGKRGLISEDTNEALRDAGIYHIVSISGLHMVMAAGVIFWLTRAVLALSATLCLLWPIRKIAALIAMLGASAYCVFSGSEVATERSLIMTLVMLGAILVDRPALSMRNLSLSALIVLAREPESLLGPSFQMSFGAVAALIAAAALLRQRPPPDFAGWVARLRHRFSYALLAMLGTTFIAGLATAPFGAFHFQMLNSWGLLGNALALPLVSLIVMPGAVLGVLAWPFGLDRPIWEIMGLACTQVLSVSHWVSDLGGARVGLAAFGSFALGLMSLGLLLLTLLATPLRWLGLVPAVFGLLLATQPVRPVLVVDREGMGAMLRGADGRLTRLGNPSRFVQEHWLRADGDLRDLSLLDDNGRCDSLGCTAFLSGIGPVAWTREARALPRDCARAVILITALKAPDSCAAPHILDAAILARHGAISLYQTSEGLSLSGTRRVPEDRPWMRGKVQTP